ncbi:MAG: hypothetical protein KAJ51_11395, partial [Thermoplasmata archaeon]|nr:hypothetical protein [Thermoplasmata archaeon]
MMNRQKKQLLIINLYSNYRRQLFAFLIIQLILISFLSSFVLALDIDKSEPLEDYNDQSSSRATVSDWEVMGLWNDIKELNTIAVGDVDNTHPG